VSILKGLSAIVTGGASGLGAQTARALSALGVKVAIFDLNEALALETANAIGGIAVVCNVTDERDVARGIALARQAHGPLQICVNCAGTMVGKRVIGRGGPMLLEDFQKVIDINLVGSFNVARLVAEQMSQNTPWRDQERGIILFTASIAAYEGQIGQAAYSASKAGIIGMTLPMARELAQHGIRVMTIAPGIMATPMIEELSQSVKESLAEQIPFPKRLGRTQEFAGLVIHLIENQFLNGSVVRLDGAIRMADK
jgi:NAD(P)-dependent dehydrogenase (short-subunit alcohol dehydrogenase family)